MAALLPLDAAFDESHTQMTHAVARPSSRLSSSAGSLHNVAIAGLSMRFCIFVCPDSRLQQRLIWLQRHGIFIMAGLSILQRLATIWVGSPCHTRFVEARNRSVGKKHNFPCVQSTLGDTPPCRPEDRSALLLGTIAWPMVDHFVLSDPYYRHVVILLYAMHVRNLVCPYKYSTVRPRLSRFSLRDPGPPGCGLQFLIVSTSPRHALACTGNRSTYSTIVLVL